MSDPVIPYPPCPSCGHHVVASDKYCSECGFPVASMDSGSADLDVLLGKSLPGGYRIVEFIAEGSMGRVYRAEQANLGRSVAVKIMNSALIAHPKMVDRFRTEARAASMLNHPNCTRVYDFGETTDKRPYIVMELLIGKNLELLLREEPFPPVTRALDIAQQILHALEEAHGQGIVHRDLKPANVFVQIQRAGGDLVKVVDFGLAKLRSAISGSTMTGLICGTPAYMAPEQATAAETDGRADLYALGVMLFEMLAGRPPFISDDANALLRMQVYDAPPILSEIAPDRCPRGMDEILAKLLAKSPADRFGTASEVAQVLGDLLLARTGERGRPFMRGALKACQECGGLYPPNARFCGECGAPGARDSLPFPLTPSMAPPPERRETHPSGIKLSERASRSSERPPALPPALSRTDDEEERTGPFRTPISRSSEPPMRRSDPRMDDQEHAQSDELLAGGRSKFDSPSGRHDFNPPSGRHDVLGRRADSDGREPIPSRREPPKVDQPRPPPGKDVRGQKLPDPAAEARRRSRRRSSISAPLADGAIARANSVAAGASLTASAQLVQLESRAGTLARAGDLRGAVAVLERAVLVIRNDMDRGELDDPIGAMALFLGKLGEANVEINEFARALELLKESISLMGTGPERVRLLLVMSRAARELGHDRESLQYLDDAETEANRETTGTRLSQRAASRASSAPPADETDRVSGVNYDARAERASSSPPVFEGAPPKKLSR